MNHHQMKRLLIVFLILLFSGQAWAQQQFFLSWDPNAEADLSHYIAYWCDPGKDIDLTDPASCSKVKNHGNWTPSTEMVGGKIRTSIQPPADGQVFFVTAVDNSANANESGESNRVKWIAQVPPPVEPPPGDTTPPAPPSGLGIIRIEVNIGVTVQ